MRTKLATRSLIFVLILLQFVASTGVAAPNCSQRLNKAREIAKAICYTALFATSLYFTASLIDWDEDEDEVKKDLEEFFLKNEHQTVFDLKYSHVDPNKLKLDKAPYVLHSKFPCDLKNKKLPAITLNGEIHGKSEPFKNDQDKRANNSSKIFFIKEGVLADIREKGPIRGLDEDMAHSLGISVRHMLLSAVKNSKDYMGAIDDFFATPSSMEAFQSLKRPLPNQKLETFAQKVDSTLATGVYDHISLRRTYFQLRARKLYGRLSRTERFEFFSMIEEANILRMKKLNIPGLNEVFAEYEGRALKNNVAENLSFLLEKVGKNFRSRVFVNEVAKLVCEAVDTGRDEIQVIMGKAHLKEVESGLRAISKNSKVALDLKTVDLSK